MKCSIININTLLVVLTILIGSSVLSYVSIFDGLLLSDLIFIAKIFLVVIILINIILIGFIIYKFRLIIITKREIFIIYPFRFLIIRSELKKIKNIKWSSFIDAKGIYYRKLTFKTENDISIAICDKEFENVDFIAKSINPNIVDYEKFDKLNIERAKSNKSTQLYNVIFAIFLTCCVIYTSLKMANWNSTKLMYVGLLSIFTITILYFNVKKYLTYKKTAANS